MSGRFDIYLARDSWLHRLDPRAKLWAVLLAGLVGLLFRHLAVLAVLLLAVHAGFLVARIPAARLRWLWRRLLPLLLLILILQPLFAPGPGPDLLRLGPLRLTVAGILEGVSFSLRAAALTLLAALLLLTTDPSHLVQGMVRMGVPYPWGLTVGLSIRYLPTTYGLLVTVREAQEARGWIMERGNPLRRARANVPILVAPIIAALRPRDNLGRALAARGLGYPAGRTVLHDLAFGRRDWAVVVLSGLAFGALLVLRYGLGFGGRPW